MRSLEKGMLPMQLCGAIYDREVSPETHEHLLKLLFAEYKTSYEYCQTHHPAPNGHGLSPHGHTLLGIMRRAKIETQLLSMRGQNQVMSVEIKPNRTRSAHHDLITFNKVMMTQSLVKNPKHMVHPSHFRKTYAAQSLATLPQLKLFPLPNENLIDISKPLFAMLIHGPAIGDESRPAFAHIVFPDTTYKMYVYVINLFERFDAVVKEHTSPPIPEKQAELPISIQPGKKRRSKGKRNTT